MNVLFTLIRLILLCEFHINKFEIEAMLKSQKPSQRAPNGHLWTI